MSLGRSEGTQWEVSLSGCLSFHCRSSVLQARTMAGCKVCKCLVPAEQKAQAVSGRMRLPQRAAMETRHPCGWLLTTDIVSGFVRDHWQFAFP